VARKKGGKKEEKQANLEFERQRMHRRYDLLKWTLGPLIWIGSTWLPLKALSGHKTTLTITFSITIAVSVIASAGLITMYIRARKAEAEVERLRSLIKDLESGNTEVKAA